MSNRFAIGVALTLGITWSGSALAAEGPMPAGTFAIGGEHLSGFFHTSSTVSAGNTKTEGSVDHFALLGMAAGAPAEIPRIGIDGFVIDGLSLGGSIGVDYSSQDQNAFFGAGAVTISTNGNTKTTTFTLAPRVGYAVMFTDSIGIWPRGGIVYYHTSISTEQVPAPGVPAQPTADRSLHFVGFALDVPFIFALAPGFAITAGPMLELSFDGSYGVDNPPPGTVATSVDLSYTTFGLSVGLLGWL